MKRTKHVRRIEKKPLEKDELFPFGMAVLLSVITVLIIGLLFFRVLPETLISIRHLSSPATTKEVMSLLFDVVVSIVSYLVVLASTRVVWRIISPGAGRTETHLTYLIDRIRLMLGLPEVVYGGDVLISDIINGKSD